jgi:hypothetical protein
MFIFNLCTHHTTDDGTANDNRGRNNTFFHHIPVKEPRVAWGRLNRQ